VHEVGLLIGGKYGGLGAKLPAARSYKWGSGSEAPVTRRFFQRSPRTIFQ